MSPLLFLLAVAAAGGRPSLAYLDAVEQYRRGDRDLVGETWWIEPLDEEIDALKRLRRTAATCGDCAEKARFEAFPHEAAVMLHTEQDVHERDQIGEREEVAPGPAPHLEAAREILEMIPDLERRRRFERPWFLAVVLHLHRRGQWLLAEEYVGEALRRYPDDPRLLLARGSLLETEATLDARADPAEAAPRMSTRARAAWKMAAAVRNRLADAEKCYRRALKAQPDLLEARVRIGRVLHTMGQPGKAAAELEAVVATPAADARLLYLAWLLLGAAREAEDRPRDAATAYRTAIGLQPDSQPARLALSHVLHRLGDRAASLEALRAAVASAGRGAKWDPWWLYLWGQSYETDGRLEALRDEVTR